MANVSSSNSQKALVPKLRFPGFEGEWHCVKLSDKAVFRKNRGQTNKTHFVSTENMKQSCAGIELYPDTEYAEGIKFQEADILIANIRPYLKKAWLATFSGACSADVLALCPVNILPSFLYSVISRDSFFDYVMSGAKGSKMPRGDKTHIMAYSFGVPGCKEQKRISDMIAWLDKRIDAQRRLVEALKSYKRGLLEYLFSFKISFCDFTQPKRVPLREVFAKITDRNSSGKIHKVFTNSAELGLIPQRDYFDKSIAVDENTNNYYVISEGDFVYNPRKSKAAPFGPFNIFRSKNVGIVSPLYTCLRPLGDLNLDYLYWYFQSSSWHRYMYDNGSQGVRHDRVSMTDDILFNIPVLLPDKPVQEKIAAILNLMQRLYETEVEKVEYLQSEKTQFLYSLFI